MHIDPTNGNSSDPSVKGPDKNQKTDHSDSASRIQADHFEKADSKNVFLKLGDFALLCVCIPARIIANEIKIECASAVQYKGVGPTLLDQTIFQGCNQIIQDTSNRISEHSRPEIALASVVDVIGGFLGFWFLLGSLMGLSVKDSSKHLESFIRQGVSHVCPALGGTPPASTNPTPGTFLPGDGDVSTNASPP